MHSRRTHSIELRHISEALMLSGHTSLDEQAKALGVHRSTAWTIVKNKHKLGRLSAKTVDRILSNPQTPPTVRRSSNNIGRKIKTELFSQKISSVGTKLDYGLSKIF
jgi:hypothetical protein